MVLTKHIMSVNSGIKKKCHEMMVNWLDKEIKHKHVHLFLFSSSSSAINLLKTKPAGTFLVRDSQGFPGSYGLAVKVETLPPGIQAKTGSFSISKHRTSISFKFNSGADPNAELVRHYLIERTPTGHVRLKGCPNEPDFGTQKFIFKINLNEQTKTFI